MSTSEPDSKPAGVTRFRKRAVVVEARQWTGANEDEMEDWTGCRSDGEPVFMMMMMLNVDNGERHAILWTEKSQRYCDLPPGSWAIAETDGSGFYPCAADMFEQTYEPVSSAEDRTEDETPQDMRPDPDWPGHWSVTCGRCDEEFGTNFRVEEIECPECESRRCPHCKAWFGAAGL